MQQAQNDLLTALNINDSQGGATEFSALVRNLIGRVQTVTLVKVTAVNAAGVAPVGFLDAQPLVHQTDGGGNIMPMGEVYSIPYFRLQGGSNAVICDPAVGDIGLCAFASRDISVVKRNKAAAAPGSRRQFDCADGLYIGGFLNSTPAQYLYFTKTGIVIHSPTSITLDAPAVTITASSVTTQTGSFAVNASSTAQFTGGAGISSDGDIKAGSVSLQSHTHKNVQTGSGNSGVPNS